MSEILSWLAEHKDIIRRGGTAAMLTSVVEAGLYAFGNKIGLGRVVNLHDIEMLNLANLATVIPTLTILEGWLNSKYMEKKNKTTVTASKKDELPRKNVLQLLAFSLASLAAYGLKDEIPLWEARKMSGERNFEKLSVDEHKSIVGDLIREQLIKSKDPMEIFKVKALVSNNNHLYTGFVDFAKYFGELYFANDTDAISRYGIDYETFLNKQFLPDMLACCHDGGVSMVTLFALCNNALNIVQKDKGTNVHDYGIDVTDERERALANIFKKTESSLTGKSGVFDQIKFISYSSANLYGGAMGMGSGMRLGETAYTIGMHDQDIDIYSRSIPTILEKLPDKYLWVAHTALQINNSLDLIEHQRTQLGGMLWDYCNGLADEDRLVSVMKDSAMSGGIERNRDFWKAIGLGVGIKDFSTLVQEPIIVAQATHPDQLFISMVELNSTDEVGNEQENPFNVAFENTRQTFLQGIAANDHNPRVNVYWLLRDQMFRPEFREYILKISGSNSNKWKEIEKAWDDHETTVQRKNELMELAFIQMGPLEYDAKFQTLLNEGMTSYYLDEMQKFPIIKAFIKGEPKVQMALMMSIRECATPWVWINMRSGPIASGSISPFNIAGTLSVWNDAIKALKEQRSDIPNEILLKLLLNGHLESEEVISYFGDMRESGNGYVEFIQKRNLQMAPILDGNYRPGFELAKDFLNKSLSSTPVT